MSLSHFIKRDHSHENGPGITTEESSSCWARFRSSICAIEAIHRSLSLSDSCFFSEDRFMPINFDDLCSSSFRALDRTAFAFVCARFDRVRVFCRCCSVQTWLFLWARHITSCRQGTLKSASNRSRACLQGRRGYQVSDTDESVLDFNELKNDNLLSFKIPRRWKHQTTKFRTATTVRNDCKSKGFLENTYHVV